jgi:hypothetical protein
MPHELNNLQTASIEFTFCRRDHPAFPAERADATTAYEQRSTPGSLLRKAIKYMLGLWPGLVRFLDDPRVPLDNAAERAMRGPVLGRKNHQGSRSLRGTQVAAQLYGLIETANLCGLDPRDYLLAATQTALLDGGMLLPHDLLG